MKTILYAFIAIFVFGILQPAFTNKAPQPNGIILQATTAKVSAQQLELAAKIITARLTDFGAEKSEVKLLGNKGQIAVRTTSIPNKEKLEKLLTRQGALAFYETCDAQSLKDLLQADKELSSLLKGNAANSSRSIIGSLPEKEIGRIQPYLEKLGSVHNCQFVWSQSAEDGNSSLYALKPSGNNGSIISGSDIESVESHQDKTSGLVEISITLKPAAVKTWADATRRNMDRSIAIVLDDKVLAAPVVRSVMEGGKCSITGNYSPEEARWIAAIGNNGALPLSFTVVK